MALAGNNPQMADLLRILHACFFHHCTFSFSNPFGLYMGVLSLAAAKRWRTPKEAEMTGFLVDKLLKMEIFFNFGTLRVVNIPFLEMPVLRAGLDNNLTAI